jgi:hypothetical protein
MSLFQSQGIRPKKSRASMVSWSQRGVSPGNSLHFRGEQGIEPVESGSPLTASTATLNADYRTILCLSGTAWIRGQIPRCFRVLGLVLSGRDNSANPSRPAKKVLGQGASSACANDWDPAQADCIRASGTTRRIDRRTHDSTRPVCTEIHLAKTELSTHDPKRTVRGVGYRY